MLLRGGQVFFKHLFALESSPGNCENILVSVEIYRLQPFFKHHHRMVTGMVYSLGKWK